MPQSADIGVSTLRTSDHYTGPATPVCTHFRPAGMNPFQFAGCPILPV